MKINLIVKISVLILFCAFGPRFEGMAQVKEDIVLGSAISVNSKILNEERKIYVYLPDGYNASKYSYPVMYLLDGEAHFKYTAGAVKFLADAGRMPEMIVVGIPNTKRNRDFTAVETKGVPEAGGAENFLKFLKTELIPKIDAEYRTQKYKILTGHSLCGMYCVYSLIKEPDLFNSYIALSPWLIASESYIFKLIKSDFPAAKTAKKKFYFTAGMLEGNDLLTSLDEFRTFLKDKAPDSFIWKYNLMPDEDHASLVLPSINDGLRFIFSGWGLTNASVESGVNGIIAHYKRISDEFGYEVKPTEAIMNQAGYTFLQRKAYDEAIAIFKRNIELYPESANVYDSCGEAFEVSGQFETAKSYYAKAYDLAKVNNDRNLEIFKTNYERMVNTLNAK